MIGHTHTTHTYIEHKKDFHLFRVWYIIHTIRMKRGKCCIYRSDFPDKVNICLLLCIHMCVCFFFPLFVCVGMNEFSIQFDLTYSTFYICITGYSAHATAIIVFYILGEKIHSIVHSIQTHTEKFCNKFQFSRKEAKKKNN